MYKKRNLLEYVSNHKNRKKLYKDLLKTFSSETEEEFIERRDRVYNKWKDIEPGAISSFEGVSYQRKITPNYLKDLYIDLEIDMYDFEQIEFLKKRQNADRIIKIQKKLNQISRSDNVPEVIVTMSMIEPYEEAILLAESNCKTILINAESGTGKEMLARFIHKSSKRNKAPLFILNCAGLNDELLESKLFGSKKGSYTGAYKDTKGIFEEAEGGFVFLDEIGDISASMQMLLLRFIEYNEFTPLGTNKVIKSDVRIILATNKNLRSLVDSGKYRDDFYGRICIPKLIIPPLRERPKGEIYCLLAYFMKQERKFKFSYDCRNLLTSHDYPGNIREIKKIIESLSILKKGEISKSVLESFIVTKISSENPPPLIPDNITLEEVKRIYCRNTLLNNNNNKTKAAKILGIKVNTLKRYLDNN